MRVKVSDNFFLDEFVDVHTYLKTPDKGLSKIHQEVIDFVQLLRQLSGHPMRVNNWWKTYLKMNEQDKSNDEIIKYIEKSDLSKWSGYRSPRCKIGAVSSEHRKSNAADPKGDEYAMFELVRQNAHEFYKKGLRRLENPKLTDGWLHMDRGMGQHKSGHIRVVNWSDHAFNIRVSDGKIVDISNLKGFKI